MITSKETKRLKEILGNSYVKELKEVMSQNDIREYSDGYLRQVFNGSVEHPLIESCIWKLASIRRERQIETESIKNQILKS